MSTTNPSDPTLEALRRDVNATVAMAAEVATAGMEHEAAVELCRAADAAGRTVAEQIAFNAYEVADAMEAERQRRG